MKLINDATHGYLDYLVGTTIILSPSLFGFEWGSAEGYTTFITGAIVLFYSFLTDYKPGIIRLISMPAHLITDRLSGIFLAASPWVFDFSTSIFIPHVIMGTMLIGLSVLSTNLGQTPDERMPYFRHHQERV